jgi:Family of unknown function (DUF5681)
MDDNSKSGYSIGYGKPPEETRFKPGRSGNPRGRPKNSRNYKTVMNKLLKERVKTEPLGWRQPNIKVVMQKLVDQALEGNWRALKLVISMMEIHDTMFETVEGDDKDDEFYQLCRRFAKPEEESSPKFPDMDCEFP